MKKTTAERLRQIIQDRSLKQVDILRLCQPYCNKFGVKLNKNDLSQYVSGKVIPKQDKLSVLAHALGVHEVWLMGYDAPSENILPIERRSFPLLGEIACGEPVFADERFETFIAASSKINADFCLIAKGDSMIDARIHDGDVVFIRRQEIVDNGQIAAVIVGDEATLKYWDYDPAKQRLVLTPANRAYRVQIYEGAELDTIRCLGRAVCFMSYC